MGTPSHYASELPSRLEFLIDKLYPAVTSGINGDEKFGGALGTTFLLAMATPMIVLPMERILRVQDGKRSAADDDQRNTKLSNEISRVFAPGETFGHSPFAQSHGWSYVSGYPRFDIAGLWPQPVLELLQSTNAQADIQVAETRQILKDLRNALSHGAITYLNTDGHHVYVEQVAMIAFAADQTFNGPNYNIISITESALRSFLAKWASWLAAN